MHAKKGRGRPPKSSLEKVQKRASLVKPKERKKKTYNPRNFRLYISRILRQVHQNTTIGKKAMNIMNDFMVDIFERLAGEASNVFKIQKRNKNQRTLMSRDIQAAVRFSLSGELAKHAISEGTKAIQKYFDKKNDA